MAPIDRTHSEALYKVFEKYALKDQEAYYRSKVDRYRTAARQINRWRAFFALLTGLASALAAFVIALTPASVCPPTMAERPASNIPAIEATVEASAAQSGETTAASTTGLGGDFQCVFLRGWLLTLLPIIGVVAPVLGGAFSTLADLYQWDRKRSIYESALENLVLADALSPSKQMPDDDYYFSLQGFAEGMLDVMRDESGQWGSLIGTPKQTLDYVERARQRAAQFGGDADAGRDANDGTVEPPLPTV
ncbi:MAG: hypothetical protein IPK19_15430 [Chloroflexi bacterium]|nr:hypothetical protein [Chloroflexota bacterium]